MAKSAKDAKMQIRMPKELREDFANRCLDEGMIPSEVVRKMIRGYLKGMIRFNIYSQENLK